MQIKEVGERRLRKLLKKRNKIMAGDIANKKFLEEEVKNMVRNEIPLLQIAVKLLQAKVAKLEEVNKPINLQKIIWPPN